MIHARVGNIELRFETAPDLFSPEKLDRGSLALLSCVHFEASDKVLDLGCGYGLVGIYSAKLIGADRVWMLDNDPAAVDCAQGNLVLNDVAGSAVLLSTGFDNLPETGFTKILSNRRITSISRSRSILSRRASTD